ncbi:hypothetical protein [Halovenus salina]|uniref:Uncharacterized protein n=1 Tax=Halovenus salina TaxID=1510225 RepID=A0ABD5W2M6_9EURY
MSCFLPDRGPQRREPFVGALGVLVEFDDWPISSESSMLTLSKATAYWLTCCPSVRISTPSATSPAVVRMSSFR